MDANKKYILNNYFGAPGAEVGLGDLIEANETAAAAAQSGVDDLVLYTSAASAGGGATEALTVTGLAADDTILAVHQSTPGANDLPLLGWSTQAANALTGIWSADPGAGAIIKVYVKKA